MRNTVIQPKLLSVLRGPKRVLNAGVVEERRPGDPLGEEECLDHSVTQARTGTELTSRMARRSPLWLSSRTLNPATCTDIVTPTFSRQTAVLPNWPNSASMGTCFEGGDKLLSYMIFHIDPSKSRPLMRMPTRSVTQGYNCLRLFRSEVDGKYVQTHGRDQRSGHRWTHARKKLRVLDLSSPATLLPCHPISRTYSGAQPLTALPRSSQPEPFIINIKPSPMPTPDRGSVSTRSPPSFKIIAGSYEKLLYGLEAHLTPTTTDNDDPSFRIDLTPIFIFSAHVSCIKAVAASPIGGKWLATGSTDEVVKVWDLRRRKEVGGLMHHQGNTVCTPWTGSDRPTQAR